MRGRRQKLTLKERRKREPKKERRVEQRGERELDRMQSIIAPQSKVEVVKDLTKLRRRK